MANQDVAALQLAMEELGQSLSLSTFAYLSQSQDAGAEVKLISNYPKAWTSHYLAENYEQVDPVILRVVNSPEPFEWGKDSWNSKLVGTQAQFMDEAAHFGIRSGFTIPIHDATSQIAAMTFATDEHHEAFHRCVEAHRSLLQLLAIFFHTYARRRLAPRRVVGGARLSPREYECLEWASRGKSALDTAAILGISRRTVVFHLENAKAKLGVRSTFQAIALFSEAQR